MYFRVQKCRRSKVQTFKRAGVQTSNLKSPLNLTANYYTGRAAPPSPPKLLGLGYLPLASSVSRSTEGCNRPITELDQLQLLTACFNGRYGRSGFQRRPIDNCR